MIYSIFYLITLFTATQKSLMQSKSIMPPEMHDSEKIIWEGLNQTRQPNIAGLFINLILKINVYMDFTIDYIRYNYNYLL